MSCLYACFQGHHQLHVKNFVTTLKSIDKTFIHNEFTYLRDFRDLTQDASHYALLQKKPGSLFRIIHDCILIACYN